MGKIRRWTLYISHVLKRCIHFVIRLQLVANLPVSGINDWKRCVSFWICLLSDVECVLLIKMYHGFSVSLPFTYHFRITQGLSEQARHKQLVKMTITSWVCVVKEQHTQFKCMRTRPRANFKSESLQFYVCLFRMSKTNQSNWCT